MIVKNSLFVSLFWSILFSSLFYSCQKQKNGESAQVSMFLGNSEHKGKYNSPSVKTAPRLVWKFKTNGQVISSPVVCYNVVYVGSRDHHLYAIDATSGDLQWTFETGGEIDATPLVAKGKVMFLSRDGFFYAVNQIDGSLAWKFQTEGETVFHVKDYFNGNFKPDFWDFYLSSPVIHRDIIYFGSSDAHVYALNVDSGKLVWSYLTGGSIHSSPAIYEDLLLIGSWDSNLYCLDANTGEKKWSYTTGRDTAQYVWLGIQGSPSAENGIAYIGSRDAKFYAFDIMTGDTLWTNDNFNQSWMPSSAAIGKEYIYTGSSDSFSFYSLDKQTGDIKYVTETDAYTFSSPAIDDEMAYIGSTNGRLFGIDLESGAIQWKFQTIGSKNDTINVFDQDGKLNRKRMESLMTGIEDMPTLSDLYREIFINVGSILSSPTIWKQTVYFGSSDGYIYAISDR